MKAQTYNHGLEEKHTKNSEFHKPQQIPVYQAVVEPRAGTALQGSIDASCRVLMNSTFLT